MLLPLTQFIGEMVMNKRIIGAVVLFVLGCAAIFGLKGFYKFFLPHIQDKQQKATSDSRRVKGRARGAYDNWIGYFPLISPEMKKSMFQAGWDIVWENDNADYEKRIKKLEKGEFDFAVATVDSDILNSVSLKFPGVIEMVIDESMGGDAIYARKDKVPNLQALKGKRGIRVAFTPKSPTEHLLKGISAHFGIPEILPPQGSRERIETNGSSEALKKILSGQADVAGLWQPDCSRADKNKSLVRLMGTEDTKKLIVDVLLINRNFAAKNPQIVKSLLSNYFRVLKIYLDNTDLFCKHVKKVETDLTDDDIRNMIKGVKWVNMTENCEEWFGISAPGATSNMSVIDTIDSTVKILIAAGDYGKNPLPDEDPYRLIDSSFLQDLYVNGVIGFTTPAANSKSGGFTNSLETKFSLLDEDGWAKLQEVGTLKMDPIIFRSGSCELNIFAREIVDDVAEKFSHYPNFRAMINGHSGTEGDSDINRQLSEDRAKAVGKYFENTHKVDPNRLRIIGLGGDKPLPQEQGEPFTAWQRRLSRVEIMLVREVY